LPSAAWPTTPEPTAGGGCPRWHTPAPVSPPSGPAARSWSGAG
jgi:hypothetical protein